MARLVHVDRKSKVTKTCYNGARPIVPVNGQSVKP